MKISVSLTHFEFKKQQTGKVKIMKKIITKTLDITPDMAAQMLERNTMNRNISQLNVTRYANDMASGAWEQNGETIKIAEDGTILDGQHRLWAIIESGVTVTMIVVYNVRKEARETVTARDKDMGDRCLQCQEGSRRLHRQRSHQTFSSPPENQRIPAPDHGGNDHKIRLDLREL